MSIQLLTIAEALEQIPLLATDAAAVQTRIHVIACSALDHVRDCGDTRAMVALLNALPKGQRVKALAHWVRSFSNGKLVMKVDKATNLWTADLSKSRAKDGSDFNISGACEITFADFTVERDPVSVTVESLVRNMVRASTNTDKHDGTDIDKVSPEARAVASRIVAWLTEQGIRKAA
jgi:hypothetical protein